MKDKLIKDYQERLEIYDRDLDDVKTEIKKQRVTGKGVDGELYYEKRCLYKLRQLCIQIIKDLESL